MCRIAKKSSASISSQCVKKPQHLFNSQSSCSFEKESFYEIHNVNRINARVEPEARDTGSVDEELLEVPRDVCDLDWREEIVGWISDYICGRWAVALEERVEGQLILTIDS
eukprot:GHVO01007100.1.p2 GENE.GHVO01007100.1~~GHVO01007100.1.p2  ORF type:complete len:111 (-),score=8.95 GHVO01007100.1:178-510(-)